MRQQLTFNGRALSDFGVWFDGSVSFGSPERDVELVEVVGRDGALSISNDRFRNIEITFPCAIRSNFITNYRNLMAFLNSSKGYCRLETTQEPSHYRKALFMNQTDPTGYKLNTHGRFDLVFQVMPQRFLKTGETTTFVSSSSSDVTGNPVSISNPSGLTSLTGLSVDIEPVQDLNGYDAPWVGGAGKNLLNDSIKTQNGSSVLFAGATGATDTEHYFTLSAGTYTFSVELVDGTTTHLYIRNVDTQGGIATKYNTNSVTFTLAETTKCVAWIYGTTVANVEHAMIESGSSVTAYAPYENICPITGHTSATVTRAVDGSATDYTIDLNGTVYGGTLDVLTGVLTVTDENIASYNGETLPSTWISDRDVYASGTTPTTGAQVVYKLATPTTVQLTAQQVSLLTGTNIISTDMNSLTVTIASPAELENPTLFESKPIIRVYGNGTLNVNDIYITVASSPYEYVDIDCELMDCYYGSNNANQYVSFSTTDFVTLQSGTNSFVNDGFTSVEVTPRWYEV